MTNDDIEQDKEKAYKAFLEDLSVITRKHKIEVTACCTCSPFLMRLQDGLSYDDKGNYVSGGNGNGVRWERDV